MADRQRRGWGKWAGMVAVGVLALGGGLVALNWSNLNAGFAAGRLKAATTDEARATEARALVAMGDAGRLHLLAALRTDDADRCFAVSGAVHAAVADLPPGDAKTAAACRPLFDAASTLSDSGRAAVLELVPVYLPCGDDAAERCRGVLTACLGGASAEAKVRAVRLCVAPQVGLKAAAVPLLDDPSAEVRRAAMLAVGPASGQAVIGDEELFRWLHDPDEQVRLLCEAALSTRDLDADQIDAGRKLAHPEASERLTLLADLLGGRSAAVRDPGPWLERLSRDPDPAVRAGAARVAYARRVRAAPWLDRLSQDPDPTVRQIAAFHRDRAADAVRQAGGE